MGSKGRIFVAEALRFNLVGACTLIVGTAVFLGMVTAGFNYVFALLGDYAAGIVFSYVANKKFTFKAKVDSDLLPFLGTVLTYVATFLLNVLLLSIAVETYQFNVMIAQIVIMLLLAIINFLMLKFLVFGVFASPIAKPQTGESAQMLEAEYFRMAEVEADMWWYTSLHAGVLDTIQRALGESRHIRILDAGCGTGGLLRYLRQHGYTSLIGLDISDTAVKLSRGQGFNVMQGSISDPSIFNEISDSSGKVDVIVSMDVICSLPNETQRVVFFREAACLLKNDGLMIVQTPAFPCLGGIHDMAVGVNKRYTKAEMHTVLRQAGVTGYRLQYRLLLLTPGIFLARLLQRLRLKWGADVAVESDVKMPPRLVNKLLFSLQRLEDRWLPFKPFGTSLQILIGAGHGKQQHDQQQHANMEQHNRGHDNEITTG